MLAHPPRVRALVLALVLLAPMALGQPTEARAEYIVTLRPGADAPAGAHLLSILPAYVADLTLSEAARLASDPRIARVDVAKPLERAGDPALPTSAVTGLTRAADSDLTGAGVTVAVVDSGIDATHPDLLGRVKTTTRLVGQEFEPGAGDTDGHGTHVAGLVGASGASSRGRWQGVAPGASLVGIDISSHFTTASAVLAYDWLYAHRAQYGIRVVVNAWGRVDPGATFDAHDPEIQAIDRLVAAGVVVLFSASNHGPDAGTLSLEAMDPNVVTVGAVDEAGQVLDFSSRGPVATTGVAWTKPDVVAPGDEVVGPRSAQTAPRADDPDAFHTIYSGTSQAVPHVAGIVALMLEAQPSLTPDEVGHQLRASAIDLGEAGPDDATGYGLVDAHDAIRMARGLDPDRGNVLVAGGVDRASDSNDITASARRSILDLVSRPQVVWETPFVVKIGAQHLHVDAAAPGANGIAIELTKGARVVPGPDVDAPEAGTWTLRMRAGVPSATRASATFETTYPPAPERALETDARDPVALPPAARATQELLGGIPRAVWIPLAIWAASGAILGYAVMPRQRKADPER